MEELPDMIHTECKRTGLCQETEGFKGTEHEGLDMCEDGCVWYKPLPETLAPTGALPLTEQEMYYKQVGDQFGYPNCCIQAFLQDTQQLISTGEIKRTQMREKWAFNGFIPCEIHAKKIEQHGYSWMSARINYKRSRMKYPLPFPYTMNDLTEMLLNSFAEGKQESEDPCMCEECQKAMTDEQIKNISSKITKSQNHMENDKSNKTN